MRIKLKDLFREFEMHAPGTPSVDQLLVLLAVVESGGFAAAGRRLHRATSAISYAIDTLEEHLGVSLFDRGTTRRPKLTQQGEAVVSEAKAVARSIDTLRARVRGLQDNLEPEVSLVVDSLFPHERLVTLLGDFHAEFPTVPVRLLTRSLGGVERAVRAGEVSIGVGGRLHMDKTGFQSFDIAGVPMIPVAARAHPLAENNAAHSHARPHVQIVLSEQGPSDGRSYGVVSLNTWRVDDIAAKHQLILAGIGWGGMPEPMVRTDLKSGRLARLKLKDYRGGVYPMQVVHMADAPPGPAGRWLIERLLAQPMETEIGIFDVPSGAARAKKRQGAPKPTVRSRTRTGSRTRASKPRTHIRKRISRRD